MSVASDPGREIPDLVIKVSQQRHNGGPALVYEVHARDSRLGLNYRTYGPQPLHFDPKEWFDRLFIEIQETDATARTGANNQALQNQLEAKGLDLFEEIFPETLQEKLWEIHNRVNSLQILSEDPFIPWELCKLQHMPAHGEVQVGPFFCEAFEMTRWFPNRANHFAFSMSRIAVSGRRTSKMPQAAAEVDDILALASGGHMVQEIPDENPTLLAAMARGGFDAWHLTGHGIRGKGEPFVTLRVGRATLAPESMTGSTRNLGGAHPLFFLNCCHAGKGEVSLTRFGGWAERLTRYNGVGAFIGAQWAVDDCDARRFAQTFYQAFLGGTCLGAAVKQARMAIKSEGKASAYAYTVFGDPMARCLPKPEAFGGNDFRELIAEQSRGLVGRDFLVKAVDDFLGENQSGYLTLSAPGGFGKTACLARLAKRTDTLAFFSSRLEATNHRELFWRNLGPRCTHHFQLDPGNRDGASLFEWMSRKLDGQKILILVDGVDELEDEESAENCLGLPQQLPDGLFVLVSGRPGAFRLQAAAPKLALLLDQDQPDHVTDLYAFAQTSLAASGPYQLNTEVLIGRLLEHAQGSFLCMKLLLGELALSRDPDHLPMGLKACYAYFLKRGETDHLQLMATLAVIAEPVTVELLCAYSGLRQSSIAGLLEPFKPLLHCSGEPVRYRLHHAMLQDHMVVHFPELCQQAHLRITEILYRHLRENDE